ncbi:MAG: hypothetical protein QM757_36365 [Paludibaculum sp.]
MRTAAALSLALGRERIEIEHIAPSVSALAGLEELGGVLDGIADLGDADASVLVGVEEGHEARIALEPLDRARGGHPLRLGNVDGLDERLEVRRLT